MPAPVLTPGRGRFVLLSQQTLTLAVVGAVALSALGVVELRIVPPQAERTARAGSSWSGATLVSTAPVSSTVRTVPFGGLSAQVLGDRTRAPHAHGAPAGDAA